MFRLRRLADQPVLAPITANPWERAAVFNCAATFLILLNPVAPHITEEIWERLKFGGMLNEQSWPTWDEAKTVEKTVEIGVQVNGKLRGTIEVNVDDPQEAAREKALANEAVQRALDGKTIVKEIYVPGRIYNIVVK